MAAETHIIGEQATEAGGKLCWNCNSAVAADDHFCPSCGKVQKAVPIDHFRFFGLDRKLNIDVPALEKAFYRLSRRLHPDAYARGAAEEQRWSLEKSSQLNDAYRTLKNPVARTRYLLELEGVKLEEQSKAATDAARQSGAQKQQVVPPELLEEVFELNVQLQGLKAAKQMGEDDLATRVELEQASKRFESMLSGIGDELKQLWNEWDMAVSRADLADTERKAVRDKMVALLNRRNYVRNLVRDVQQVLES